jgi:hypothetical protein
MDVVDAFARHRFAVLVVGLLVKGFEGMPEPEIVAFPKRRCTTIP